MFSLIGKIPKLITVISLFISVFLLSFLLMGCLDTSSTYSDVYFASLSYNKSSGFYSEVEAKYKDSNSSSTLAKMSVRIGYIATCVALDGKFTCTSFGSLLKLSSYSGISLLEDADDANDMDLVKIAKDINETCHPRVLMAAIIITLVLLVVLCYVSIPLLPGKNLGRKFICLLSSANVLLWGLGAMLQHQAANTSKQIVGSASMNIVSASIGKRAEAMSWTAFSFLLIVCLGSFFTYIREIRKSSLAMDPKV
ncbi:uncharacterized protein PRCAT00001886001 [Priceomyces carsonii]|uniref:uncharacterized protein n=1 Tax=Priceomyces carsonii TaxID=28549 RepID=UPI002EDB97D4|nr:unnamed protein product [Priceomyces carsonii]